MFHITAIDLYGNTVYTDTIPLTYSNTAAYYQQITDKVKDFIEKNQYPEDKILGVSIATQGITSPDKYHCYLRKHYEQHRYASEGFFQASALSLPSGA